MGSQEPGLEDQTATLRRLENALAGRYNFFKRHVPGDSVWDAWGLECGPGWQPLLLKFADKAVELEATVRIRQIKEKFHSLRLYCDITPSDGTDDTLYNFIDELEEQSKSMCEICSASGCKERHTAQEFIDYCEAAVRQLEVH